MGRREREIGSDRFVFISFFFALMSLDLETSFTVLKDNI